MDYNITLTANHQSLTAEYLPLAAESVQYLTAQVICETEDWTGREIKAMFGQGCTVYGITVTDGEITAKQQLNLTAGDWCVWLVGNSARDGEVIPRITTNVAHISVAPTGGTEGNPFPSMPPTAEEQLRADMGNLADLTTEDKSSLVAAINEVAEGGSKDAVKYTPQTLTDEQQAQARENIGAGLPLYVITATQQDSSMYLFALDKTTAEIEAAYQAGYQIMCRMPATPFIPLPLDLPLVSRIAARKFAFGVATANSDGEFMAEMLSADDDGAVGYYASGSDRYYVKPAEGIPKADFANDVQTSLDKADAAISLGLTSVTTGQIIKIKAVDGDGKPTEWEAVDMPSGGEIWEKVADITLTDNVNSMRATFDACSAVYVQLQWGGVADDLGNIFIVPNSGDTPYTIEKRAVAAAIKTSDQQKRGYLIVTIDTRKGSVWTAISYGAYRADGNFGEISPDKFMNCDIGLFSNFSFSVVNNSYFTTKNEPLSNGVTSITVVGAGMAVGTTLRVWGIKK